MPTWSSSASASPLKAAPKRDSSERSRPAWRIERHLHVLAHAQRGEGGGDLEGAADAQPPDGARAQAHDVAAAQPHDAGVGRELAVQHVEAGALARAVGPDQRQQLAGVDGEGDVGHRLHAAERLVQPLDLQHRAHARPPSDATSALRPPTRPCGKSSTISRITAADHGAPEFGAARATSSRSQVKMRRAHDRTGERLDTAQQHHDQPVGRLGDGDRRRARCCPWRRRRRAPARPAANVPASTKAAHWKARTSMPIASARNGESRPARSA